VGNIDLKMKNDVNGRGVQRWKSQRTKIHRLADRFSIEFSLLGLAFDLVSQILDLFLAITNI
jgi:hypothetical protein